MPRRRRDPSHRDRASRASHRTGSLQARSPIFPHQRRLRIEPLEDRRLLSVNFTGSYAQDFDSLPSSPLQPEVGDSHPWTNDGTLEGWHLFRQPAPGTAIPSINLRDGSSNAGSFAAGRRLR